MSTQQNRLRGMEETGQVYPQEMVQRTEEIVRQHPASSALVTFGVGMAVGLLVAGVATAQRSDRAEFELPEWVSRRQLKRMLPRNVFRGLRQSSHWFS